MQKKTNQLSCQMGTKGRATRCSETSGDSPSHGRQEAIGPRYVELVRVSGRNQVERETPESQRRDLDRLARSRPGIRIARIEALAVSAALPIEQTVQGQQLLALAGDGFDELRLWDVDRGLGARADDPRDRLAVFGMAREAGAVIVDCSGRVIDPEKEMGELDYYLRTFFAAQERRKIVQRTRAGKQRVAADGEYSGAGFLPYGLEWNRDRRQWSIDETRAAIVREVYRRCIAGDAIGTIVADLNARGIPTQQRKRWYAGTVQRMLRSPAYRGEHTLEGITVQVPAIIDDTTWHEVQHLLEARPKRRKARTTQSLCVGRVWCPCGQRAYVRLTRDREYIYCMSRHDRWRHVHGGKPCEYSVGHRADRIDPVVWQTVADAISQPQILQAAITGTNDDNTEEHREELARRETLLKRLTSNENEISRAFRRGDLSAEAWRSQLKELATERRTLQRSRDIAREQVAAAESIARSMDAVETQLQDLRQRIQDAEPQDQKAIIQAVVPGEQPFGIVLWPDGKIEVRGAIPVPPPEPTNVVNVSHSSGQSE